MIKNLRVTVDGKEFQVSVELLPDASTQGPALPAPAQATAVPAPPPPSVPAPVLPPSPHAAAPGDVVSPLAGRIESIQVQINQNVAAGDPLVTLEAMKMNTCVNAPSAGIVTEILIEPGAAVKEGQLLIRLKTG